MQGRPADRKVDTEFLRGIARLEYGKFDGVKLADYLEQVISNTYVEKNVPVHYFAEDVASQVRASKQLDNTYRIDTTDTDIIKYCKSFINFIRAVRGINSDIIEPYIQHLQAPDTLSTFTDTNIYSIAFTLVIDSYFTNKNEQFNNFHKHFMAFRFYAIEVGDIVLQMPFIKKKYYATLNLATKAYQQSNTKHAVDLYQKNQADRERAQQAVIAEKKIPHLPVNHLLEVFSNFRLRTHIDAWTEMTEALCAQQTKSGDTYVYDVATVSIEDRRHMDLYNMCSGAKRAMVAANAAICKINASEDNKRSGETWKVITEEIRGEYIKLNDAMRELMGHIENMKPLLQQEPELYSIYKKDIVRINAQIKLLKSWEESKAPKKIDILKGSITANNVFAWTKEYAESRLTEHKQHYDAINDLYIVNDIADEAIHNMMLIYNMNSRLENAYPRVQRFREEGFSLGLLPEACRLLFEVGNIIKDFRHMRGTEITEFIKTKISEDINVLIRELADILYEFVYLAQKLETSQGLKPDVLLEKLKPFFTIYTKLLNYNNGLPNQYKLDIKTASFNEATLVEIQQLAIDEVSYKKHKRIETAVAVREALNHTKNVDNPLDLVELLRITSELRKLDSYKAKQYIQSIQIVIDKLLGLDVLTQQINHYELAIKEIIGDNSTQLHLSAKNPQIAAYRESIDGLYKMQAMIRDRLDAMEQHIDNPRALAAIPVEHFHVLGYQERFFNHIKTYVGFSAVNMYQVSEGTYPGLDEDALISGLTDFQISMREDLNALVATRNGIVPASLPHEKESSKAEKKKTQTEIINHALLNNQNLLKYILDSRKGYAILQIESLRRQFITYAKDYIHADYHPLLEGKYFLASDTFQITGEDTIATVNVKALHNTVSRMERLLELLNYIAEAPTEGKIAKAFFGKRIKDSLPELKKRIIDFAFELQVLKESLSTLRGGLANNTINIFRRDLVEQINHLFGYTQAGVNYFYDHFADSNEPNHRADINNAINDVKEWFQWLGWLSSPSSETGNQAVDFNYTQDFSKYIETPSESDQDNSEIKREAKIIIRQAIKNAGDALKHISNANDIVHRMANDDNQIMLFLKLFVESAGPITKHYNGNYAIEDLRDGSLQKCIAAFLNCSDSITKFMDASVSLVDGHQLTGFIKSLYHLARIKYQLDKSQLLDIFQDGLQQYQFNAHVVHHLIDALIAKSCAYLVPNVMDFVGQARIAEATLGLNEGALVGMLEWVINSVITLGETIAPGQLVKLKTEYPYDSTTLELAKAEIDRLALLEENEDSKYHYYTNAINSLKLFRKNLSARLSVPASPFGAAPAKNVPQPSQPTIAKPTPATKKALPTRMDESIPALAHDFTDTSSDESSDSEIPSTLKPVPELETPSYEDTSELLREGYMQLDPLKQGGTNRLAASNKDVLDNLTKLKLACSQYKHYLATEIDRLSRLESERTTAYFPFNHKRHKAREASSHLRVAIEKFNVVVALQDAFTQSKSPYVQLANFHNALTPSRRHILAQCRDNATTYFLKILATIFSLGIAVAFGLWKSEGEKLVERLDYLNPPNRIIAAPSA